MLLISCFLDPKRYIRQHNFCNICPKNYPEEFKLEYGAYKSSPENLILDRNKEMGTVKKMIGQDYMIRVGKTHLQKNIIKGDD